MAKRIVIIGAGIAGLHAAIELRNQSFDGDVILVDQHSDLPYDRPPLSKGFLSGNLSDEDITFYESSYFEEQNIALKLGNAVIKVDTDNKQIILENGEKITWDKLLLATGSTLRKLNIPGNELKHIHYLKTKEDALKLKKDIDNINEIAIIGAGFIGSEVAATCRDLGINVTLIEALPTPLGRVLGNDIGEIIADMHKSYGVNLITNEYAVEFKGDESIEAIITNTGRIIPCQAAVIGIGVQLNLDIIEGTGISTENGIKVNKYGETNTPDIFAAGDIALWPYRGQHIRIEHWDHSMNQGRTVAKNMVNPQSEVYETIPYFWSDQYDIKIQYLGHAMEWDETVIRGNVNDKKFTVFYMKDQKIVSALFFNDPKNVLPTRKFINQEKIFKNIQDLSDVNLNIRKIQTV